MPKAFQFRMERLLELRRLQEDLKKRDLAEANRAVAQRQQVILLLLVEENTAQKDLKGLRGADRELDLTAIRLQEQYRNWIDRRIVQSYRELQGFQQTAVERRRELSEASKGVRVLERLRERKRSEHQYATDREEQKFLDEVAQRVACATREESR